MAQITCVFCGEAFAAKGSARSCSAVCREAYTVACRREWWADPGHRARRNERRNERRADPAYREREKAQERARCAANPAYRARKEARKRARKAANPAYQARLRERARTYSAEGQAGLWLLRSKGYLGPIPEGLESAAISAGRRVYRAFLAGKIPTLE